MLMTLVHVRVKSEAVEAFKEATRLNHEHSVQEPGHRRHSAQSVRIKMAVRLRMTD